MKITEVKNILACFSEAADGDLSFYLMSDEQIKKIWNELPVAARFSLPAPAFVNQIHGDAIVFIDEKKSFAAGPADALITGLKNQPVGVFSADCLPLLLFNDKVCAAAHAGWRGTRLDIAARTVAAFSSKYGQEPASVKALIGPCIGQCCLEMGDEVFEEFVNTDPAYGQFFERRGKWHLNMRAMNRFQLIRAGVKPENISDQEDCTFCREKEFFSFRRQRKRNGSMFSFVVNRDAN